MAQWHNWSGRLKHKPQHLTHVYSEDQAASLALACSKAGQSLRAVGGGHSHQDLVGNNDVIVDTLGLSGVISSDLASNTAWVWAGSRIFSLGNALHQVGLALPNQGDIDQQSISGATATGTHGTGATLQNLSSRVVGARLALADGSLVDCCATENSELWQASRLHLGAFGIITRLQLALNPSFRLVEKTWQTPLSTLLQELDGYIANNRHCEFFWYPRTDNAQVKVINETVEPAQYPLGNEGHRQGWSYEVLPNHRPHKHTEMEYSIPAESGMACMIEIQKLLADTFTDVSWPVEYRTLAEDDVWLSTAYQRATVTISVHQGIDEPDEAYYRACEEVFLAHGGKPHWGKVNYLNAEQMADLHPRWRDWWRVRDNADPSGTFLNPYMHSIRP